MRGLCDGGGNILVQPSKGSVSVVAFGDRNDFLQVLRVWHFRRKCHTRNTCKRDAGRGSASACTGLLVSQFVMSSLIVVAGRARGWALYFVLVYTWVPN